MLKLRNPHSVIAALETRPQDVTQVVLPVQMREDEGWGKVARLAQKNRIPVVNAQPARSGPPSHFKRTRFDGGPPAETPEEGGRTGQAEATVKERESLPLEELFSGAKERAGGKGLWIALDSLQDPHNVGAIFRAAAFFGVQGIIITQERSAPLTSTVYDVASGGLEGVPFTLQVNLQRAFEVAKEAGLWILGTSEHAHDSLASVQRDRPWLLVLGNEEKGMRRLTEEACDVLCKIAPHSPDARVGSLNVSVAAGVFISTLTR